MLWLYRQALRIRADEPGLGDGPFAWVDSVPDTLAFSRGDAFRNVTNLSDAPIALGEHRGILLASSPLEDGLLPADSTVWLRTHSRHQTD
jgi:alpha-glucosidase